jgi:murein DD-endopeptidase MepM/ murein hydrolase activator NlpD
MKSGSTVVAADAGTVVFSGSGGSYGYLVKIDHGKGVVSYYGHNSKLLVKVGDKVFKGQTISLSGNTGRSTGPHLHFEIRVNDIPVNPEKYLKF